MGKTRICKAFIVGIFIAIFTFAGVSPHITLAGNGDDDDFAEAVAGSYFLLQSVGSKRTITLTTDETFFSVSSEQNNFGFTDGQGAWKRSGDQEVTAKMLDFDFNLMTGVATGVTAVDFVITFADEEDEKFQTCTGTLQARQFAFDQNPLDPNETPINVFDPDTFTCQRITIDVDDDDDD